MSVVRHIGPSQVDRAIGRGVFGFVGLRGTLMLHDRRQLACAHCVVRVAVLLWCGLAAAAPLSARAAEPRRIAIVSTPHPVYRQVASVIEPRLKEKGHTCLAIELPKSSGTSPSRSDAETDESEETDEGTPTSASATTLPQDSATAAALRQITDAKPALIVTIGASATSSVLRGIPDAPVVFCLVPNALDASFMAADSANRPRLAGVTTDVSPAEQIAWFEKLHGRGKTLGLLYSSRTEQTAKSIEAAGKAREMTVVLIKSTKQEFPKAIDALASENCDGVLMIADAAVYNSASIQRLLLWGIRQKKPAWAFSANLVKAGAFAGLYANSSAIGEQTAGLVQKIVDGAKIATLGLQYPARVDSVVSERIADMIGIKLTDQVLEQFTLRLGKDD